MHDAGHISGTACAELFAHNCGSAEQVLGAWKRSPEAGGSGNHSAVLRLNLARDPTQSCRLFKPTLATAKAASPRVAAALLTFSASSPSAGQAGRVITACSAGRAGIAGKPLILAGPRVLQSLLGCRLSLASLLNPT